MSVYFISLKLDNELAYSVKFSAIKSLYIVLVYNDVINTVTNTEPDGLGKSSFKLTAIVSENQAKL